MELGILSWSFRKEPTTLLKFNSPMVSTRSKFYYHAHCSNDLLFAPAKALGCDAMTDSGPSASYNFYFYDLDHLFYLQVQLDSLSSVGNAEIYVAHDYLPGRLNSDVSTSKRLNTQVDIYYFRQFSVVGGSSSKQLQIPPTKQGRLYIAVYITASFTYTIRYLAQRQYWTT